MNAAMVVTWVGSVGMLGLLLSSGCDGRSSQDLGYRNDGAGAGNCSGSGAGDGSGSSWCSTSGSGAGSGSSSESCSGSGTGSGACSGSGTGSGTGSGSGSGSGDGSASTSGSTGATDEPGCRCLRPGLEDLFVDPECSTPVSDPQDVDPQECLEYAFKDVYQRNAYGQCTAVYSAAGVCEWVTEWDPAVCQPYLDQRDAAWDDYVEHLDDCCEACGTYCVFPPDQWYPTQPAADATQACISHHQSAYYEWGVGEDRIKDCIDAGCGEETCRGDDPAVDAGSCDKRGHYPERMQCPDEPYWNPDQTKRCVEWEGGRVEFWYCTWPEYPCNADNPSEIPTEPPP